MIDRQSEAETIDAFRRLEIGRAMLFDDGWWAYFNDERPSVLLQQRPKRRAPD
jgi:hypothetical protein